MNDKDPIEIAKDVLSMEAAGILEVRDRLNGGFTDSLELLLDCKGRVVVTGVGKSGLVGRKIAATMSSTGTPALFLHPVDAAHGDMGLVRDGDVVIAISNSGETEELLNILPSLKAFGARIVGLTGKTGSTLAAMSDAVIDCGVSREACPLGLAPTSSTTAALAVGDALALCLLELKDFNAQDFRRYHPAGHLGQMLCRKVRDVMREAPPACPDTASLRTALDVLNAGGVGTVILTDAVGHLTGILTDGDVRRMVCRGPFDLAAPVSDYMTRGPKRAHPDQSAAEVLDIMESKSITVLPIVGKADRVLGVVHLHDLLGKGRLKFAGPK